MMISAISKLCQRQILRAIYYNSVIFHTISLYNLLGRSRFHSRFFHSVCKTADTLRRFVSRTDFVIVERVIFSVLNRGKVGHYNICTVKNALFPTKRIDRAQGGCCRQRMFGFKSLIIESNISTRLTSP